MALRLPALVFALFVAVPSVAQEANALLKRASQAMGADGLKTLRYSGHGSAWAFGQAFEPGGLWPKQNLPSYVRMIDFGAAAWREDFVRSRAEPNGGGPLPLSGEQRVTQVFAGTLAWNMAGPAGQPTPVAVPLRLHDLWTTPHGVLMAAARNQARLQFRSEQGRELAAVSFHEPGRFSATAYINADYLVERVESVLPHPVLGDTSSVIHYEDYRATGNVQFPARIRQVLGGHPVLDLAVTEVQVNVPVMIEAPENVRTAVERIGVERAAEGVWYLTGGSHHSVAIEMRDGIIVIESPLYDGRAGLMLSAANALVPGKRVKSVINSHHHFDHAGGLRTAAAEGAEIYVHAKARPFFARAFETPNRIAPDRLAQSKKRVSLVPVAESQVIEDGGRRVEIHAITDSIHAGAFLMVYLPAEKLLIEADAYTPLAPNAPPPVPANANHVNLVANIERLGLKVERILPLHGRIVPIAELYRMVGRTAP